jgi:TolB protein
MAFTRRLPGQEEKAIWTCSPLGRDLQRITSMGGFALSPTWSNDGRYIVFSHVGERYHSLGLWDRKTGKVSSKRYPGNTVIGPTFTPENKVAVSMASGGNPDIFLLSHTFEKEELLVDNWAIDVSPDMDAMGRRMAFVSSRLGNPHIFVLDTASGETRRVTFEGKYNTHPSMSPDGTLVVFSRMTDMGHRIFLHDLETGMERQLTFGPGNDEEPTFAPDGYFVAFSSDRAGRKQLYLTTRHGDAPRLIPTGEGAANFPAWGPDPAKQ